MPFRFQVTRFVILFVERAGSTYLITALKSQPGVLALTEKLAALREEGKNAAEQLEWAKGFLTPPLTGPHRAIGFKTKLVDVLHREGFSRVLQQRGCRVIRLQRRNPIKAVVSTLNARRQYKVSGNWNLLQESTRLPAFAVDLGAAVALRQWTFGFGASGLANRIEWDELDDPSLQPDQWTIRTVLDAIPGATLADVQRMLTDEQYRYAVADRTKDEELQRFWTGEYRWYPKNVADPVLNKLSVFLLNRQVRNIICQRKSRLDFDRVLSDRTILLANLSTGLLTEKVAGMIGSFLVTKIVNAAFRRAKLPEHERRPFFLYVDEFQSFMNLSIGFERILAEARKYKLVLAGLANQYVGQLTPSVRQAVFGNVGSFIVFRLGVDDAYLVAKELGVFTAEDILNLMETLNREFKKTIVMVTHDPRAAARAHVERHLEKGVLTASVSRHEVTA